MWGHDNVWFRKGSNRVMTYLQFLECEYLEAKGKYVSVVYDDESQARLRAWALENGFDLTYAWDGKRQAAEDFEFHTTLFYCQQPVVMKNGTLFERPTEVFVRGIAMFGPKEDIAVLKISSPGINDIREIMAHEYGLVDSWPKYNPHITVCYGPALIDMSNIELPDFRPKFDKIVIEDLVE